MWGSPVVTFPIKKRINSVSCLLVEWKPLETWIRDVTDEGDHLVGASALEVLVTSRQMISKGVEMKDQE